MPPARTLWNRRIAMRDGVEVAADVLLPAGAGPWPAVVNRTPYLRGRNLATWGRLVDHGYVFVSVDQRGRGDSDGEWTALVHDGHDGFDVVEWVAAQPWCTGRVGMVGGSYEGRTQWWTARHRPPHLRCIVPQAVGAASEGPRFTQDTGVPHQYRIWWFNLVSGRTMQNAGAPSWTANYDRLPLRDLHEHVGASHAWWPRYVAGEIEPLGPDHALSTEDWERFAVPALVGVGWWDDQTTMTTWTTVSASPAGPRSKLLIGAWDHAGNLAPRPVLGGLDVAASAIDTFAYVERFLALHLKDEPDELARCRVFRTGALEWESLDDWPAPAEEAAWHCGAGGTLVEEQPGPGGDAYTYDPADPPRDFSNLDVFAWSDPPLDSRYLLRRDDVLFYASAPLERRVDVSGRARFEGAVSVDCPDTDLAVGIYDVAPDGRAIVLGDLSIQRLAFRNGPVAEPLPPGEPVDVRIELSWLHHAFLPGHRIGLALLSAAYPHWALNRNTGEPWADAVDARVARVTIHRPGSRLVLPREPVT
jgi:putative CocE/NonD family hydrolase